MSDILKVPMDGSIYDVPQQLLAGEENVPENVTHALARACVVHCAAAALDPEHAPSVEELVDFVVENGAGSGSDMYTEGIGWNNIAIADLLRHKDYSVVSQNLKYGANDFNLEAATASGRVRSDKEKERLVMLTENGGQERGKWLDAIRYTHAYGGKVIALINIPLMSGDGFGTHAVLVEEVNDQGMVTYFDPDHYNTARFGASPPPIQRAHPDRLMYHRPAQDFLQAMTGGVIHIFPS